MVVERSPAEMVAVVEREVPVMTMVLSGPDPSGSNIEKRIEYIPQFDIMLESSTQREGFAFQLGYDGNQHILNVCIILEIMKIVIITFI